MSREERIRQRLFDTFSPEYIGIKDKSHLHAHHRPPESITETHFSVTIVADAFTNIRPLERQRKINDALKDEFQSGLHSLELKVRTPPEHQAWQEAKGR